MFLVWRRMEQFRNDYKPESIRRQIYEFKTTVNYLLIAIIEVLTVINFMILARLWCRINMLADINVSEEYSVSNFRV
jgi:hypothetical protein